MYTTLFLSRPDDTANDIVSSENIDLFSELLSEMMFKITLPQLQLEAAFDACSADIVKP